MQTSVSVTDKVKGHVKGHGGNDMDKQDYVVGDSSCCTMFVLWQQDNNERR